MLPGMPSVMVQGEPLIALIDRLRAMSVASADALEAVLGVPLVPTPILSRPNVISGPIRAGGVTFARMEWRIFPCGGALVVLDVAKQGLSREAVMRRYAPLDLFATPCGHSLDEATVWARREPWGELRFGFTERAPDRLSRIVLQIDASWDDDPQLDV